MPETIVGGGDYCGRLVLPKSSVAFSPPHGGLLFSTLNLIHKLPLAYSSVVFLNSVPRSHIAHCLVETTGIRTNSLVVRTRHLPFLLDCSADGVKTWDAHCC